MDGARIQGHGRRSAYIFSAAGMKKGDLAKFIEEAVRWRVFDQTVAETKARNAEIPAREINAAIDEALAVVRAEKFGSRRT